MDLSPSPICFSGREVVLKRSTIWLSGQKYANIIEEGGPGIKDLRKMNVSLLCKWWWKLDNEEGLWQNIFRFKYIKVDYLHG
jgi:hypothetical protein